MQGECSLVFVHGSVPGVGESQEHCSYGAGTRGHCVPLAVSPL